MYCIYNELGCEWEGPLGQLETHCTDCIFRGVACPHSGCGQMVPERQIEGHKLICDWRMISCDQCSEKVEYCRLDVTTYY